MQTGIFEKARKEFRAISAILLFHGILPLAGMFGLNMILLKGLFSFSTAYTLQIFFSYILPMLATITLFFVGKAWLKPDLQKKKGFSLSSMGKYLVFMLGMNVFCSILVNLIRWWLGIHSYGGQMLFTCQTVLNFLILLYIVVIGPVFEELLFRGVILRTLDRYHRVFAILISSALFGMMHLNGIQLIPSFFTGCVLAYASLKEDSILLPILLHILNNLFSLLTLLPVLSLVTFLVALGCYGGMIFLLHQHNQDISALFRQEYCTYPYGRMFFSQWTTILYIVFFFLILFFIG